MKKSAGILLYRKKIESLEVFLVHPGGPMWKGKESGAWTIPKGEFVDPELPLSAAIREFEEETGKKISGRFLELNPIKQKAGKLVYAWAVEGNIDEKNIISNTFEIEWPYKSGKLKTFPEVDKASWFDMETAKSMINPAQSTFIDDLVEKLSAE